MTHLVCGSCKRQLEHVQTCFSTRVCLTQHPSDTLRLFRELNCHTSYMAFSSFPYLKKTAKISQHRGNGSSVVTEHCQSLLITSLQQNSLWHLLDKRLDGLTVLKVNILAFDGNQTSALHQSLYH